MIGISKLYCGVAEPSDALRYDWRPAPGAETTRKPVVVFNCTRRCNLRCAHCYSASDARADDGALTGTEARALLDDLAAFGVPVVLFSGGEPLLREDLPELIAHARQAGLRVVLSTNGTRITTAVAGELARLGVGYVGVSLDGLGECNDAFRGQAGAFEAALAGIRHCRDAGVKVGLRVTLHQGNVAQVPALFDLLRSERIPRVCFYHLVPAGRGDSLAQAALSHDRTRAALDSILDHAASLHREGNPIEVLTVDNHADGAYLYLRLLREDPARAEQCLRLLRRNGGNSSGSGIAAVSWNGDVHPDQFWRTQVVGNVRRQAFSKLWASPPPGSLLAMLRERSARLGGRCPRCRFLDICNGNLRARAQAATGDLWGDDPACYLTDEEIAP
ncbi:MAG TPA: 12,18-didecarboxysiroheme deacetylase [Phycisphaerales bacterium]|nr:12,18-didecarboxysiroheme deacetylase [Phycisphaerales bacterium]